MLALPSSLCLWVRQVSTFHLHGATQLADTCVRIGLICFIFLICSLRTNIVFFLIFFTLVCAFGCLAGAYWNLALAYENAANTFAAKRAGQLVIVSSLPPPTPTYPKKEL